MATRQVTVSLSTIGASAGPFNISDDVIGVIAMNVSRAQLLAGYSVNTDVNSTQITIASVGSCTNSITLYFSTPTPTPTPTAGPTATPTPTPTPTPVPVYFDSIYTGYSNVSGAGGRVWTRLTAPSGTLVQLTVTAYQFIPAIAGGQSSACISGSLYQTTLPATTPVPGTIITSASGSVALGYTPGYPNDSKVVSINVPAVGYQDLLLVYRTKNLASGYNNGQAKVQITAVNSSPVTGGDYIQTQYNYTDSGTC